MTAPDASSADRSSPVHGAANLRWWRSGFAIMVVAALAVLVFSHFASRSAARRTFHSGTVLRSVSEAQRDLWALESALRRAFLGGDTAALATTLDAQAKVAEDLEFLRQLVADDPTSVAMVDSAGAAVRHWEEVFVAPTRAGGAFTRGIAMQGTQAFDEVTARLAALERHQSTRRLAYIGRQERVAWLSLAFLLLTTVAAATRFRRVALALEREAERARRAAAELEAQAAEMEQQTRTLEEQATQLEETTAELEHRIEERDETNRLLEETALYLEAAVESAPLGIAFYDRELRIVRCNPALAALSGQPAEAHVGRATPELLPELGTRLAPVLARVLRTGLPESDVTIEAALPALPQVRRRWSATCFPLRPRGRAPVGASLMLMDLTERTHLEEQLRQAQKMEAVGRLAGGIAHDFNNVLTVIQSYGELLASGLDEGTAAREEVDAIRSAADRAATLARQLLAFSRREVIIPRVLDVNDIVRGMESILRRLLRQGIELELDLANEALLARCDAGQVEQVLMNLAINAVDAMPSGGRLMVRTRPADILPGPDGPLATPAVVVAVVDTGTGMAPEVQRLLFEPFFTTKPAGRGTGLGLATAYAIVRGAGGVIRVETSEGNGSTFEVLLPRLPESERDRDPRLSPAKGVMAIGGGETILLAEDEPAIRAALARMLRTSGYTVIEASNGGEALRLAEETPGVIDLLLTDVMMPGIGGKELVQRLLQVRPGTRIILMSGYTDDEMLRRDLGDARYVFLQKPFAAKQAVAAVREVLDQA